MPGQKQRAETSAQRPLYQEGAVSGADWGSFKASPPDCRSGGVFLIQKKSCPNGQLFLIGN